MEIMFLLGMGMGLYLIVGFILGFKPKNIENEPKG